MFEVEATQQTLTGVTPAVLIRRVTRLQIYPRGI